MTNEKLIEILARLDGIPTKKSRSGNLVDIHGNSLPNYLAPLEGHGHLQRIIDGFDDETLELYDCKLCELTDDGSIERFNDWKIHRATPLQKAEAIARATGNWGDEGNPKITSRSEA